MSNFQQSFEKLAGSENYADWKFHMRMLLIHEDLLKFIEPTTGAEGSSTDSRKDQIALSKICLMVEKQCISHVRSCKTAKEAWTNLEKVYEVQSLNSRLKIMRKLCSISLGDFNSMETYINAATELADRLRMMNKPLDDDFFSAIILQGLTPEYDPLVMSLEASNADLSSDAIKNKLLAGERDSAEDQALFVNRHIKKKEDKSFRRDQKERKCYICGSKSHFQNQCEKRKNGRIERAS